MSTKPRVTEIIRAVGLGKDFTGIDPFYRDRGTAVHKCIELYLAGNLDESSIDPNCQPYFDGFLKWWAEYKTDTFTSELHLENDDYQGTLDLVTGIDDCQQIWDFKCSKSHDRVAEVQGAGYKNLLETGEPFRIVQLPGDGSFKVIEYESPIALWDATWTLYQWKSKR